MMDCRCRANGETRIAYRMLDSSHLEDLEECGSVIFIWLPQRRPRFDSRPVHVGFVVDRVVNG
jgi:hypothetical protein